MSVSRVPFTSITMVPRYLLLAISSLVVLSSIGTYMVLQPAAPIAAVPTATVKWGTIATFIPVTGTVGKHQVVEISSSTSGQIVDWLVQEGSVVKAGAPLAYFTDNAINQQIYETLRQRIWLHNNLGYFEGGLGWIMKYMQ